MYTTQPLEMHVVKKNLTHEYVANRLGITQKNYSDIENGKISIKDETLLALSEILELPVTKICKLSCKCLDQHEQKLTRILDYLQSQNIKIPESII